MNFLTEAVTIIPEKVNVEVEEKFYSLFKSLEKVASSHEKNKNIEMTKKPGTAKNKILASIMLKLLNFVVCGVPLAKIEL